MRDDVKNVKRHVRQSSCEVEMITSENVIGPLINFDSFWLKGANDVSMQQHMLDKVRTTSITTLFCIPINTKYNIRFGVIKT